MKITFNLKKLAFLSLASALLFASACKKTESDPDNPIDPGTNPALSTRENLTKDSIYLYAQQTYYWNAGMPAYAAFNPRQYSTNQAVLDAIKALPSTGKPTDKYSFIDNGAVASELGGTSGDFGFIVIFQSSDDLRIKYVYAGSPAAVAGLKRGDRVLSFNGTGGTNVSNANSTFINLLNNAFYGSVNTITMTVQRQDGTQANVIVNRGTYSINPVMYTNVYTVGTKKVGYIVFSSFTTNATSRLDAAFATFATAGISEIVVDLRYNGGGSVATAVDFTNLIAPSSRTGQTMFTTYFNTTMQNDQATILQNQKLYATGNDGVRRLYSYFDFDYRPTLEAGNVDQFTKRGAVNGITRAYFLVTSGTASASELLINNLKPIMDVKLIGRTTYGKPVGFFAIRIDKSDLYIPQFETKNSLNQGGYYTGMVPDVDLQDDATRDFGDMNERYLSYALNYALKGNFTMSASKLNMLSSIGTMSKAEERDMVDELSKGEFKGMVDDRPVLRKR